MENLDPKGDSLESRQGAGSAQHEKLVRMVDSAMESGGKIMLENHLAGMAFNLKSVSGEDWAKFRSLVSNLDMTDEETQAAEETIQMVQSMRPEFSVERRNKGLQSFAKKSKIIDVAIALKVFDRLPHHKWEVTGSMSCIRSAATYLMEALALISNRYHVEEALKLQGHGISEDEHNEIIERGKHINIV